MTNALFTYRVPFKIGDEVFSNDNFICPPQVVSFYWAFRQDREGVMLEPKEKVLNVFLTNGKTIIFPVSIGTRFVSHMEDFLRFSIFGTPQTTNQNNNEAPNRKVRKQHSPLAAEFVDEEIPSTSSAEFVS